MLTHFLRPPVFRCALLCTTRRQTSPVSRFISTTVVAADSLIKRDILRLPDPFAIVSVDGEQIHTTSVIKRTLNPYWNENFDM